MNEKELYGELGALTQKKEDWRKSITYVSSLLQNQSVKITAKTLWLLGEMGMNHPDEIQPYVCQIASFLDSSNPLLQERALNALGRIGRSRFSSVEPYWEKMLGLAKHENPQVRLAFIWASENIATNAADAYVHSLPVFAELLHDSENKVRMEAPEMFRVMGKRKPQMVLPYLDVLRSLADNDPNRVVRIHSAGAFRITNKALNGD